MKFAVPEQRALTYTLSRDPHSSVAICPDNDLYSQRIQEYALYPVVLSSLI